MNSLVAAACSGLAIVVVATGAHYGWWMLLAGLAAGALLGFSHAYVAARR